MQPILSALPRLIREAQGAMDKVADEHRTDCVAPLDHHHGPIIVQFGGTGRPAATPYPASMPKY